MIPVGVGAAALTALAYGVTPVCARRAIRLLGFARANLWRLLVALAVMGALAFTVGRGLGDQTAAFAVAGAIGFGLGGFALFRALPLLGAPLGSLLVETTAAVVAGLLAWVWLADVVPITALVCSVVILVGVVLGLAPYVRADVRGDPPRAARRHPRLGPGIALAVLAAVAQAVSGVLTRRALLATQQAETARSGGGVRVGTSFEHVFSSAFDRLIGGVVVALVLLLVVRLLTATRRAGGSGGPADPGAVWTEPTARIGRVLPDRAWFWVGANAVFGPIVGVTSMVWALQTLQPGVAQAIAALAPLIAIPAARWLEGYRPPARYWVGAVTAVLGLTGLALS